MDADVSANQAYKLGPGHHNYHTTTTQHHPHHGPGNGRRSGHGHGPMLNTNTTELIISVARYDRPRRSASDTRPSRSSGNSSTHNRHSKSKPRSSTLALMTALQAPPTTTSPTLTPSSPTSSPMTKSSQSQSGSDGTRSSRSQASITTLRQTEEMRGRRESNHNRSISAMDLDSNDIIGEKPYGRPRQPFTSKNGKRHHAYPIRRVPYPRNYENEVVD
jgi:hypothetical protein